MAVIPTGKPTLDQIFAAFQAFRTYMARRNCENNRLRAALECFTTAQDALLQLQMEIIRANFANRPLDPEYIRGRRAQIAEREKVCNTRVEQRYQACMQMVKSSSSVRKRRSKR
jgi:hypothetical protein